MCCLMPVHMLTNTKVLRPLPLGKTCNLGKLVNTLISGNVSLALLY